MSPTPATDGVVLDDPNGVRESVSKYYGQTLQTSADLKTSACCTAKAPPAEVRQVLAQVPEEVRAKYYGCGSPFPVGMSGQPLAVLDLGCGSGRDCYVAAALVGPKGKVTGVDMTDEQLVVARGHADQWMSHLCYTTPNMTFLKGTIEALGAAGVSPGSQDLVISNCVINLSADKAACLREVAAALKEGGEMYFSDVYCDRRLAPEVRRHEVLLGECLGGALYLNDFIALARQAGFTDPRVAEAAEIEVHDPALKQLLGEARFFSVTFRLFKLPGMDLFCEQYGQTATYLGTMASTPDAYTLDADHVFPKGVAVPVCSNTAAMVGASWLAPYFKVEGSTAVHSGMFCSSNSCALSAASIMQLAAATAPGGAAGSKGGCCPPGAAAADSIAAGASCCPPIKTAAPACCPPSTTAAPAPAAAAAAGGGGGCCPGQGAKRCC